MTAVFVKCLNEQCELFVSGYFRSLNISHSTPLDVIRTCFLFVPSTVIIPNLRTPSFTIPQSLSSDCDEDISEDEHLCEDEISDRDYIWENELFGICKYIKTMRTNVDSTVKQYKGKLLKDYNSLKCGTNVIIQQVKPIRKLKFQQTLNEIQNQNVLHPHPHIQRLHDVRQKSELFTLMYDYSSTTLFHVCRSGHYLTEIQIKYILYQILLGIKSIHASNIKHNNIKSQNILISNDCSVRISNFKKADNIKYDQQQQHTSTVVQTRYDI